MEERHFTPRPFGEAHGIMQRRKRMMTAGEMSVARWERVFTSRKRTMMQKASDMEMSTQCQVTLTIRSPAGQVWYYATSEELRQKMIKSTLINSSSFHVTREGLENNIVPTPENIGQCISPEQEVIHKQHPEPPQTSILHAQQSGREEPCPSFQSTRSNPITLEFGSHGNQSNAAVGQPAAKQGKTQKFGPCDNHPIRIKDKTANQNETQKFTLHHNDLSREEPPAAKRCKMQKSDLRDSQPTQTTTKKNCKPNDPSKKEEAWKIAMKNTFGRQSKDDKSNMNRKSQETTIKNTAARSTVKKSNNYENPRLNKNSIEQAANNIHVIISESEDETKSEDVSSDTCMTTTRKTRDLSRCASNTARKSQTAGVLSQQNLKDGQTDNVPPGRIENAPHKFARFSFRSPQRRFPTEAELEEERKQLPPRPPENPVPAKPHVPPRTRSESSSSSSSESSSDSDDSSDDGDDSSSSSSSSSEDETPVTCHKNSVPARSLQTTATVETSSKSPGTKVLFPKPQKEQQKPASKSESPFTSNSENINCFVKFEKNSYDFLPSPVKVPKTQASKPVKTTTGPKKGKNVKKKANQKKKVTVTKKAPFSKIKMKAVQTNPALKCSVTSKTKKKRNRYKKKNNIAKVIPCKGTAKLSQVAQSKAKVNLEPGKSNTPVSVNGHGEQTPGAMEGNGTINATSNTNYTKGSIPQDSATKSVGHSTHNAKQGNAQNSNANLNARTNRSLNKKWVEARFSESSDKCRRNSESENDSNWRLKSYHDSGEQSYQYYGPRVETESVHCNPYQNQPDGYRQVLQTSRENTDLVQGNYDYSTKTSDLKRRPPLLGEKPYSLPHTYPLHGSYQMQPEGYCQVLQTSRDQTNLVQGNCDYNTETSDLKRRPPLLGEKPDSLPQAYPLHRPYQNHPEGNVQILQTSPDNTNLAQGNYDYNSKTSDLKRRPPLLGEKPDSLSYNYPVRGPYQNQPEDNQQVLETALDKTNLVQENCDYDTKTADLKRGPPFLGAKPPDSLPHTQKTYSSTSPDGSTQYMYSSSWPKQCLTTGDNYWYNPHRDNVAFSQNSKSELQDFEKQLRDGFFTVQRQPKYQRFNKQHGGKDIGFRNAPLDKHLGNPSKSQASTRFKRCKLSTSGHNNKKSAKPNKNNKKKMQQQRPPPKARPWKSPRATTPKKATAKVRPFNQI